MKSKLISLIIISLMIASSISIGSVSAWEGFSDIESGKFVYLSQTGWKNQAITLTNDIDNGFTNDDDRTFIWCKLNDNYDREKFNILNKHSHESSYWDPAYNSRHQAKFYLTEEGGSSTPWYYINDLDWSRGLFIAADTSGYDQSADVYYYDTNGNAQYKEFKYSN
ncbi:MAG: hypothetical protein LBC39_02210 [Methanobrevibacter sp.]|jgi:hypothetical protein|nr:hypothetical protein [Candidatus Methanovirga aequatorialis]